MFLSTDKTEQWVNEQLFIGDKTLNSEPCITLLGMDIYNLRTFNKHIADLCKKAASQLNVLKRLSRSMGHTERKLIMQAFTLMNFNYCPLIRHFCSESNTAKIAKIQERALRLVLDGSHFCTSCDFNSCCYTNPIFQENQEVLKTNCICRNKALIPF